MQLDQGNKVLKSSFAINPAYTVFWLLSDTDKYSYVNDISFRIILVVYRLDESGSMHTLFIVALSSFTICLAAVGKLRTIEPPRDKTNKVTVRPLKTQISQGIRPV